MNCPYCENKLTKIKTKYRCEKCSKVFTWQELDIFEQEDWLDEHRETINMMINNKSVDGC